MGIRINLSSIDFTKAGDAVGEATQSVIKFARKHKAGILSGISLISIVDNIRVRQGRKKDQRVFEKSSTEQQQVARKHEAEINVLKAEAEKAQEASRRVDLLEQIVKNTTEGVEMCEKIQVRRI